MKKLYWAVIEEGDEPGYSVFFPDVPGCTSAGDTALQAAEHAQTALTAHLALLIEDGAALPDTSDIDLRRLDPDIRVHSVVIVPADIPSASRAVRLNVTLPEDLVRRIDAAAPNRSRFLAQAAEKALARR